MPHIDSMRESNFIKKEDVGAGKLVTIESIVQENVAKQGADPEMKWCMFVSGFEKPMVMNSTNLQLIGKFLGPITENWIGKQVVLYNDPNVSMAGRLTGGIRCRAPRNQPAQVVIPRTPAPPTFQAPSPQAQPQQQALDETDDSVPF